MMMTTRMMKELFATVRMATNSPKTRPDAKMSMNVKFMAKKRTPMTMMMMEKVVISSRKLRFAHIHART